MAWRDAGSAAALTLLALFALAQSLRLDVGTVTVPGPGFFPLVLSLALAVVAIVLVVHAGRRGTRFRLGSVLRPFGADVTADPDATDLAEGATRVGGPQRWALIATIVVLAVYVAVFEVLGFVLATIALLGFLFAMIARYRWLVAIAAAVAVTLAARLVFDTWLEVRLPVGLLGR